MFWRVMVYVVVGLFVFSFVLPTVVALIADLIHRYLAPSTCSPSDSLDAKPQDG